MSIEKIALFPTCLVDVMRPSVGFAALKLLEDAGYNVDVPLNLTCCGQPAYNSGDKKNAQKLAKHTLNCLQGFDYIIIPSGSCGGMIIHHYPTLFEEGTIEHQLAKDIAKKCFELTTFLAEKTNLDLNNLILNASYTYHDSCAGYRELDIYDQPRALLDQIQGLEFKPMKESTICCGFGGTFCVKYPEISNEMVIDKAQNAIDSGADLILGGDMGCLMNIAGKLQRQGNTHIQVRHIAEVLSGDLSSPAIGLSHAEMQNIDITNSEQSTEANIENQQEGKV